MSNGNNPNRQYTFTVRGHADVTGGSSAEWVTNLGNDEADALVYTNLGFDLVAMAMAKLGAEFSKYMLDKDADRLRAEISKVQDALKPDVAI